MQGDVESVGPCLGGMRSLVGLGREAWGVKKDIVWKLPYEL